MTRRICFALLVGLGVACDLPDDDEPSSGTEAASSTTSQTSSTDPSSTSEAAEDTSTSSSTTAGSGQEGSSGEASSSGSSETGSSSSGGETGGVQGDYGPCEGDDDLCPTGTTCQLHGGPLSGSQWCAPECEVARTCAAAPSGTAEPTCYTIGNSSICALACDPTLTCPDGMDCLSFGGSGGDAGLCAWPSF
jgi:hypothetical protein